MTCPVCGKPQPCAHGWRNSSVLIDAHNAESVAESTSRAIGETGAFSEGPGRPATDSAWRQEVASRVQQHRARRRKSGDANALELDFTTEEPYSFTAEPSHVPPPPQRFSEIVIKTDVPKVIRFPRPIAAQPPAVEEVRFDELAEPVPEAPRILEAPENEGGFIESDFVEMVEVAPALSAEPAAAPAEQMQLLPSFADIRLEPEDNRLTDELDVIPHAAPLAQRVVAGVVDAAIVLAASGVFALTFLQLAEETPQSRLTMACALAAGGVFWLAFQYLFLTHGGRTPGMRLAQLELCSFDGKPVSPFARRSRALASALSGFAVGLGYFWALIDEDRMGWHDRISQTYLRGSGQQSAFSDQPWDTMDWRKNLGNTDEYDK